ncbi:heavy metal translocating P-type ATPase [Candidatus Parabeggiatoa sp. HSG14]|uniref:heavy metal translocating P-type ATPase n=1 Tax=Candidatus Parabeggiatoa sp. HSG14 TaxID=3055593 RepID=UPI0025A709EB|nr:heavy metal translocating P-type ATPase [Thiotrichales bacterium HSG14]
MLTKVGIFLSAYVGMRLFEKHRQKKTLNNVGIRLFKKHRQKETLNNIIVAKESDTLQPSPKTEQLVNETTDKVRERQFKVSLFSLGISTLTQFFYPNLALLSIGLYIYSFPYMRESEKALIKDRKIDSNVLTAMAFISAIATHQYFATGFINMYYHLEGKVKAKVLSQSKKMLINLFEQQPRKVWVLKNEVEIEMPLETLHINDIVVVSTGDVVPVDGIIVEGIAIIDQHALTGESQPVEKNVGDQVFAATMVMMTNKLYVKVKKTGKETNIAKISDILNRTVDFKMGVQLKGEEWANQEILLQLGITSAALLAVGPIGASAILNGNFGYRIRLIGPLQTLNHLTLAFQQGILIKDGRSLELLSKIDTILFDKTGTLTREEPEVGRIILYNDHYTEDEILTYTAAAEGKLTHPIARAILKKSEESNLSLPKVENSNYQIGYGITVSIENKIIQVGSTRFMVLEGISVPKIIEEEMKHSFNQGHSLIMVAIDHQFAGIIEIQSSLRPEVKKIINGLRQRGIKHLAIVSGDHKQPTQKLANELGMDSFFYDVMPENKAKIVEELQKKGKSVCFIGDGVNDSIAIKKANMSISLHGASSIATDMAQVVLMDGELSNLCQLFDLAKDLDYKLRNCLIISVIPFPFIVGGVFLFHLGLVSTILINQIGLWAGVGYAMNVKKLEHDKNNE